MLLRSTLPVTAAFLAPAAAFAQTAPEATPRASAASAPDPVAMSDEEADDGETVVVTGQRPRGSVVGDIPPEDVLTQRDIRATGATSIAELLDAVAAQTGSARGRTSGRPILLLNGQRISGFRELRDLPPEAIERMEILPEEVALKYGYAADARVVNIVLRQRFDSTSVEARARTATDGGFVAGQSEATKLLIRNGQRTSLNLRLDGNGSITEAERGIDLAEPVTPDPRAQRTLVGQARGARVTGTINRTILTGVGATLTAEAGRTTGRSRFGLDSVTFDPLARTSSSDSAALGLALNTTRGKWRLSATGNADLVHGVTHSDRDLAPFDDRSRSDRHSFGLDATANGPLLALPAGDATATFKLAAGRTALDSRATRAGVVSTTDLARSSGEGSVSLDLPILARGAKLGRLTANANAALARLSDFGTLTSLGAGLNWAPAPRLTFLASVTQEEGAPSLQQLGDPLIETSDVRFFDAVRGETVNVTTLTGGNPDLAADKRRVFKLGAGWQPVEKIDLRLRADYVRSTIDRPQASFPAVSEALEAAFPDRFVRDADGTLLRVDLRPVNFESARRDSLRLGFDFTKPLKSTPPSPAAIAALRERFLAGRQAASGGAAGAPGTTPAPGGESPPRDGAQDGQRGGLRFGGPGGGGGGRFGGGRTGGRLTLSVTHTINLADRVTIADALDNLDYLDGEAVGQTGGRSRHQLEVETGYYNNGLGVRLSTDWRSATNVDSGLGSGDLRFSSYAKVDLRVFANLGERVELVSKHPWLRGTSVRFDVDNIFNARPKVRDATGDTPFSYQPGLLEPTGRTVGITLRKLFVPIRFFQRGGGRRPAG
jgi:hypothetical protein